MKKTTEPNVEIGTSAAPEMFYIKILADGPYLVYGNPPIDQEIIMPNEDGASWVYKKGRHYKTEGEYTALCRCGESCKKPFCDGSHSKAALESGRNKRQTSFIGRCRTVRRSGNGIGR